MTDIPAGWEATEYTRADGIKLIVQNDGGGWYAYKAIGSEGSLGPFPTPAAAIAALEEAERG